MKTTIFNKFRNPTVYNHDTEVARGGQNEVSESYNNKIRAV